MIFTLLAEILSFWQKIRYASSLTARRYNASVIKIPTETVGYPMVGYGTLWFGMVEKFGALTELKKGYVA